MIDRHCCTLSCGSCESAKKLTVGLPILHTIWMEVVKHSRLLAPDLMRAGTKHSRQAIAADATTGRHTGPTTQQAPVTAGSEQNFPVTAGSPAPPPPPPPSLHTSTQTSTSILSPQLWANPLLIFYQLPLGLDFCRQPKQSPIRDMPQQPQAPPLIRLLCRQQQLPSL